MSSLAVIELPPSTPSVVVAAQTRSFQLRLSDALAGLPCHLRVAASLPTAIALDAGGDVLVSYHESLCADDCGSFKQVKAKFPLLLLVAVCESADGRAVRRALDSGIDGLVHADELEAALGPTVAAVLAGQIALPHNLRTFLRKPSLSARERKVLSLLMTGLTNSEISAHLFLAESTVKSHLSSAYTKLGVRSRSEAVSVLLDPNEPFGLGIGVVRP